MKILAFAAHDELLALQAGVSEALRESVCLRRGDVADGIDLARAEDPDVIFLDLDPPGGGACDFCQRLKAEEGLRAITVVFLTSLASLREHRARAMAVGGDIFLARPLETLAVALTIRTMARLKAARVSGRQPAAAARGLFPKKAVILDAIPVHIALLDHRGVITSVNDAWRRFGATNALRAPEFALGQNYLEVCDHAVGEWSEEAAAVAAGIRGVLADELQEFAVEYPCHSPTQQRWFRLVVAPLCARDSLGAMVMHIDLTERKRAEESRIMLATAVEQAAESIVLTDTDGRILYANPAFEKVSGFTRGEALGQNPRLLKSGRQDEVFYRRMWETLGRGEIWRGHFINKRKDGTLYEEEATISPVRDAAGRPVNYVAVKRDVTHEVELEAEFRQAQKMEAIGQLAGGVAHDFNNILAALLLQTELTELVADLPAAAREGLREIRRYTDRAANLIRQLLLFSRREVMQPRDLDLNEVVASLARMLQRIIGEDIRVQLNLAPQPVRLRADEGMLDQVLMNLAVNARDAMPQGGRVLIATTERVLDEHLARLHSDALPGRYACLTVSDTGCGIPPEILPRIFDPFFTTKEPGKGTGLGLATVFGIVKQHRGWLTVESQPGQGTTFQIFLPTHITPAAAPDEAVAQPHPPRGTETILLVEDEAAVRSLTRLLLTRQGYQVLEAANGVQALELWREHRESVSLLLTDLVMPAGLSGQELARRLQVDQPQLKVILISGYGGEIAGRELNLGPGEKYLQKPCAPDLLLSAIRACLDGG